MTRNLRGIAFIAAASLTLGMLATPANAVGPFRFRVMSFARITPAMNGMTGMTNGMLMNPSFNVRAGFVTMPTFHRQEMMFRHFEMRDAERTLLLLSGVGMTGAVGYPSMSAGYGGGGYAQMSSVPAGAYENNLANSGANALAPDVTRILTAAGLPNQEGQLNWPIGLQVLYPVSENGESFRQLEARLQTAALQKATGSVDGQLVEEANRDVGKMRAKLRQRQPSMQAPTYAEADRFLKNLDSSLKQLQGSKTDSNTK